MQWLVNLLQQSIHDPAAPCIEPLEDRRLLSLSALTVGPSLSPAAATIPANINISRMKYNQSEGAVAIDPSNPLRVFAISNLDRGLGLFTATSSDGGGTWSKRIIATGKDGLVGACCDPSASFDAYGNLFVSYLNDAATQVLLIRSTDGGQSFARLATFRGNVDQPTTTTGPGGVWLTFQQRGQLVAAGAAVSGLGSTGKFQTPQQIPGSKDGNFGDIAVGPDGQVMVTWQYPTGNAGPAKIYVSVDKDGLGSGGFGKSVLATATTVGGFAPIPAQSEGEIDAEAGLAYDRSGGVANGRVYLVYTSSPKHVPTDTNIYLRFSSDDGATWSKAKLINDDTTSNSQFLPRIALDQSSGQVGISWYDCRNDNGLSPGSTNRIANDDAQFWGAIGQPTATGISFAANFQISAGTSNAARARNAIDYGDYTGLAFAGGTMIPIWSDNSNSTGDNPAGKLNSLDMVVAVILA